MPIIYSYPKVTTLSTQDLFVISKVNTSTGVIENKSVEADDLASYVTNRVFLNVVAGDATFTVVNLDTQSLSITGTLNEIETRVPTGQVLQIGLPDSVTITNDLIVGDEITASRGVISGPFAIGNDLTVSSLTETGTLQVNSTAFVGGVLTMEDNINMTQNGRIINLENPTGAQDAATKSYVDNAVTGLLEFKGTFRADTGEILSGANTGSYLYNCPGGAGSRVGFNTGDYYIVDLSGQFYCSGDLLQAGDSIVATRDRFADQSVIADWATLEGDNIEGTGLANTVPLWTDSQILGNSNISQTNSGSITISENLLVDQKEIEAGTMIIGGTAEISGELTMEDNIDMTGNGNIINLIDPVNAQDAATKAYVDGLTTANSNSITANADDIADLQTSVSTNINNIATNANDITGLQTDVSTNTSNISTNTSSISTNTNDIADLQTDVSTNTGDISTNATAITGKVAKAGDTMSGDLTILKTTGNPVLRVQSEETTGGNFQTAIINLRAKETSTNTETVGQFQVHGPNSINTGGAGNVVIQNQTLAGGQVVIASKSGGGNTNWNRFKENGQVQFEEYGSGTLTGTAAYNISVDASGNLIETPNSSGGVTFDYTDNSTNLILGESLTFGVGKSGNVGLGDFAFENNTVSSSNTGIGFQALRNNVGGGGSNTALGASALEGVSTTTGYYNTAVGARAGHVIASGYNNVFVGNEAGDNVTNGRDNTSIGAFSGGGITVGIENTIVGSISGNGVQSSKNVVIGNNAGNTNFTGSNNIIIGYGAEASGSTAANEITIGDANVNSLRLPGIQAGASDGDVLTYSSSSGNITLQPSSGVAQTTGSYTPQLIAATPSEWVISSYSIQQGKWVRIGNMVFCDFTIIISASNISGNTGGTSSLTIQGWPYDHSGGSSGFQGGALNQCDGFDIQSTGTSTTLNSGLGNAKLNILKQNAAITNYFATQGMKTGDLNNGNSISISGSFSYLTTDSATLNAGATIDT